MDIISLINEYKKIDFNNQKNGQSRRNTDKYINFTIIYLVFLSFIYYFLSENTIIINISVSIVFILFLTSRFREKTLLNYSKKHDRMTYIEMTLQDKIFSDDLNKIFDSNDSEILYTTYNGNKDSLIIKRDIVLYEGIPCKSILSAIKKHYLNKDKETKKLTEQEIENVLKAEGTPLGKMLTFIDEIK